MPESHPIQQLWATSSFVRKLFPNIDSSQSIIMCMNSIGVNAFLCIIFNETKRPPPILKFLAWQYTKVEIRTSFAYTIQQNSKDTLKSVARGHQSTSLQKYIWFFSFSVRIYSAEGGRGLTESREPSLFGKEKVMIWYSLVIDHRYCCSAELGPFGLQLRRQVFLFR